MTARPAPRDVPVPRVIPGAVALAERPRLRPWLVFVAFVVAAFFGLILSRISLDRSAFVLDELEDQIEAQEELHWELRLEVARLQDPGRIAAAATGMGLVYPDQRYVLDGPRRPQTSLDPEDRWAQLKALLSAQP